MYIKGSTTAPYFNIMIVLIFRGIAIIVRHSYFYNKNPYTGEMAFLYWDALRPVNCWWCCSAISPVMYNTYLHTNFIRIGYLIWAQPNAVQCHYNAVSFLQNINRHPHSLSMRILWGQALIIVLPRSLQWWMYYRVLLHHIKTALHCSYNMIIYCSEIFLSHISYTLTVMWWDIYWLQVHLARCCRNTVHYHMIFHATLQWSIT